MIRMRNLAPDVRARLATTGITINPAANVYYVSSTAANAGNSGKSGTDPANPFATLAGLIASGPTLVKGDVVVLMPNHVENVIAAAGISLGVTNVTVIGIGDGDSRPKFTFLTSTAATWTVGDAGTTIANIVITNSTTDQVVSPIVISAAGCSLVDCEIRDVDTTHEFVTGILTTAGAARLRIARLKYIGQAGGSHNTIAVSLVGVVHGDIDIDFFGKASTAVVNFATTLCSDIKVTGTIANSTSDLSLGVVDTITGSTWSANYFDETAGRQVYGSQVSPIGTIDPAPRTATFTKPDVTVATAWTTGNSPITLFTVTGRVLMQVAAFTTAAFTSTATTGTLALGVTAATTLFMGTTTANGTNFPAGNVPWVGTTAVVGAALQQNTSQWFLNASANVILTVATNNMTAGGIVIYVKWIPLSAGATVVAAAS